MPKPERPKYRQLTLDGIPIVLDRPRSLRTGAIVLLDFDDRVVRRVVRGGETWLIGVDVCKAIDAGNPNQRLARLDDCEKGIQIVDTPGGKQELVIINEFGLYRLLLTTRKRKGKEHPLVTRFREWVTREVIPSIRKTGSYSINPTDRVASIQRSLHCDLRTAKNRDEQRVTNVTCHADLRASGAKRKQFQEWNNAPYEGMYGGMKAADLRRSTKRKGTPLNWSDGTNIAVNTLSKTLALRAAQENGIPLADRPALLRQIAQEVARSSLDQLGPDFAFGITEHPKRGRILDVVRVQLIAPGQH